MSGKPRLAAAVSGAFGMLSSREAALVAFVQGFHRGAQCSRPDAAVPSQEGFADVRVCRLASLESRFAGLASGRRALANGAALPPRRLVFSGSAVERSRVAALGRSIERCSGIPPALCALPPSGWTGVLRNVPVRRRLADCMPGTHVVTVAPRASTGSTGTRVAGPVVAAQQAESVRA